jgi:hypothetical protein
MEIRAELFLQDAVNPANFLLLPKLKSVIRNFGPALPVLARRVSPALNRTFIFETALSF